MRSIMISLLGSLFSGMFFPAVAYAGGRGEWDRIANCYRFYGTARGRSLCVQGNEVSALTAENLGMLRGIRREGDYHEAMSRIDQMRRDGGGVPVFGYPGGGDAQNGGRPSSRREKVITWAGIGAGLGYGIGGDAQSTALGAAAGAGLGAIIGRRRTGDDRNNGDEPYFGREGRQGQFELANVTSVPLDVFDGRKFVGRMQPGDTWQVPPPKDRYRAEALVPNSRGGISRGGLEVQATATGWIFLEPAVARAGR